VTPAIQLFWARHTRIARPDERAFQTSRQGFGQGFRTVILHTAVAYGWRISARTDDPRDRCMDRLRRDWAVSANLCWIKHAGKILR
jgi:hypothetical protein